MVEGIAEVAVEVVIVAEPEAAVLPLVVGVYVYVGFVGNVAGFIAGTNP